MTTATRPPSPQDAELARVAALPALDVPVSLPSPPPRFLVQLVLGLNRLLTRITDALTPAPLAMLIKQIGMGSTMLVGAAARHRIADHLAEGPLSAADLAARTGLHADSVHRFMRTLVSLNVFRLLPDGRFANDRLSSTLKSDQKPTLRDFAEYFASDSNVRAWLALDHSLTTGESAFVHTHGKSVWAYFDEHPYEREVFARGMASNTQIEAPAIATGYPFGELRKLCDVGGGRGLLLSEILIRHPQLEGVLYDAQGVLDSGLPLLEARGVAHRVERIAGSFFEAVPAGCDAYLMKNILHDWDDPSCLTILANIRRVVQPGQPVLIVENEVRSDTTDFGAMADLQMMIVCDGGRERSRDELASLLSRAGFRLERTIPLASPSYIFEGRAV